MHNWIYLIVSIILKNHFSNIKIIKDPSKNSGVITVPMETKSPVFSCVIISGICSYKAHWVSLVSKQMIFIISCNVFNSFQLMFSLGFYKWFYFLVWFCLIFWRACCQCLVRYFLVMLLSLMRNILFVYVCVCICLGEACHWTGFLECRLNSYSTLWKQEISKTGEGFYWASTVWCRMFNFCKRVLFWDTDPWTFHIMNPSLWWRYWGSERPNVFPKGTYLKHNSPPCIPFGRLLFFCVCTRLNCGSEHNAGPLEFVLQVNI